MRLVCGGGRYGFAIRGTRRRFSQGERAFGGSPLFHTRRQKDRYGFAIHGLLIHALGGKDGSGLNGLGIVNGDGIWNDGIVDGLGIRMDGVVLADCVMDKIIAHRSDFF